MYFRVCPHCGCAIDPSERCDCQQERRSKQEQEERRAQNGKVHVYGAGQHSISASSKGRESQRNSIQARMREVFQEEMSKNGGNEGKWNVEKVETEE